MGMNNELISDSYNVILDVLENATQIDGDEVAGFGAKPDGQCTQMLDGKRSLTARHSEGFGSLKVHDPIHFPSLALIHREGLLPSAAF
jgi:hypothetical protein